MESLEFETVELYCHISDAIANRAKSKYKNMNHHSGQMSCLLFLDGKDGVEQSELRNHLGIKAPSLSELLLKLEKRDLITRVPSSQNKRTFLVSITEAGHEEAEKSRKLILEDGCQMLESLSGEEKQLFYSILEKINEHYCNAGKREKEEH